MHPQSWKRKKNTTQLPCRKFETKDMEHKGQFWRQLLHINPPASSHWVRTAAPLLLQPFPLITGSRSLQPDISRRLKAAPLLWSCVKCIKREAVCCHQDKSSTRYGPVEPLHALKSWLKGEVKSKRRSPGLNYWSDASLWIFMLFVCEAQWWQGDWWGAGGS